MKHDAASNLIRHVVGFNIRSLRKRQKHSLSRFAKMVGISRTYMSHIEAGRVNATLDVLVKIADGLDVPLTDLFEGLELCAPNRLPHETTYSALRLP